MWSVKLTDSQRDALRALLKAQGEVGPSLRRRARGTRVRPLGRAARRRAGLGASQRAGSAPGHRRGRRRLGPRRRALVGAEELEPGASPSPGAQPAATAGAPQRGLAGRLPPLHEQRGRRAEAELLVEALRVVGVRAASARSPAGRSPRPRAPAPRRAHAPGSPGARRRPPDRPPPDRPRPLARSPPGVRRTRTRRSRVWPREALAPPLPGNARSPSRPPSRGSGAPPSTSTREGSSSSSKPPSSSRLTNTRRSPRRSCVRASRPRSARATRPGIGSSISSPIAADTSRPTKSSSASGPIGWPAPSFMHVSTACGSMPLSSSRRTALNRYGNSRRFTTKPGSAGHLDGASCRAPRRARGRAGACRTLASSGKASSTSFIFSTGLKTWMPAKRSGRPLAAASSGPTATRWWRPPRRPRPAARPSSPSSVALHAQVLDDCLDDEGAVGELLDVGDDVHVVTEPLAHALGRVLAARPEDHARDARPRRCARPRAIAPLPTIPSRSVRVRLTHESIEYSTHWKRLLTPEGATRRFDHMPMESGREVVIVEAVRTPIGRGHPEKGYYKDTHPNELLGKRYTRGHRARGHRPASEVEDVVTGCVQQFGEQMFNVGRNAWLQAGLPIETPATTVDRQCGSAQQARELRRGADRLRRPRRRDRLRRRAHGPHPDGRRLQVGRRGRLALAPTS